MLTVSPSPQGLVLPCLSGHCASSSLGSGLSQAAVQVKEGPLNWKGAGSSAKATLTLRWMDGDCEWNWARCRMESLPEIQGNASVLRSSRKTVRCGGLFFVISALQTLRQEDCYKFETSLVYIEFVCLCPTTTTTHMHIPHITFTWTHT